MADKCFKIIIKTNANISFEIEMSYKCPFYWDLFITFAINFFYHIFI